MIGAMVCLLAAPWVQLSVSAGNGWSHNALRHHRLMPISCHFRDCKALLVTSLTHVSGAIASVQTLTFIFTCMVGAACWLRCSVCADRVPDMSCTNDTELTAHANGTCYNDTSLVGIWNETVFESATHLKRTSASEEYYK